MQWLEPWDEVEPGESTRAFREGWQAQLAREVGPGHVLYGQSASLIGRRYDGDDALFRLADGRIALVHLTWRKSQEPDPQWPATTIYASAKAWEEDGLARDHADWVASGGE